MRPSEILDRHRLFIRQLVENNKACNPRVFGSVATGEDREGSDIDIVVDPLPGATLFNIGAIQATLEKTLGIPVDVLTPRAVPASFRARVLEEAKPL